ncbi:DUF937 domain-containing protein [Pseudonocardia acidicola]|uniref:DUF937 domain-containing protein n=1 Tax=Pseudonocardia acidicola TaxID=2724939 RepID=A0ABX1SJ31_9PSEU|nr:DUF937 domain-containing protein [Pseudonocardia acidicola]NMI00250.1 DUF937 domain-containing protein [Pseudonocardia acidicola]
MSAVEDIMSQIPMNELAGKLGVDPQTAEQATRQALPALLGGIQANTADPAGAQSFASAVQQHDPGLVEGGVDLHDVNAQEGDKIVDHVLGDNRPEVVNQLGNLGGPGGKELMDKLLPMLAPIAMSWLAKSLTEHAAPAGATPAAAPAGGLGGLLGNVLGEAERAGLGNLLGGLLGGSRH